MKVEFTLNGKPTSVDVESGTPLLWVLRDVLDLKGTKFGCGASLCGACTVHIDGKATRTCRLPAEDVAGAKVTTIEGLSVDGTHPVQLAWKEIDVPQCGYCQAGQMMTVSALLESNPTPTDGQIDSAMNRNLCRCATYSRIRKAIHHSAELMAQQTRPSSAATASSDSEAQ